MTVLSKWENFICPRIAQIRLQSQANRVSDSVPDGISQQALDGQSIGIWQAWRDLADTLDAKRHCHRKILAETKHDSSHGEKVRP